MNETEDWWLRTAGRNISQTTAEADRLRGWRRSNSAPIYHRFWAVFQLLSTIALWGAVAIVVYVIVHS